MQCQRHPTYQAKRKPTADCADCRNMWRMRRLTPAEATHLLNLVTEEAQSGDYYGNREQHYARQVRLIEWLKEQM
jgi:hypothetical protein